MRSCVALLSLAALLRLSGCTSSHGGDAPQGISAASAGNEGRVATSSETETVPRDPTTPQTREELTQYLHMLEHCIVNRAPEETAQERWDFCMMTDFWNDDCGADD
jgi:hypothetical protein